MNTQQKITIVEDEPAIREMYIFKLEQAGYSVKAAKDGKEALTVLKAHNPDLVLLDIKLPKLPGQEVLRWLRAQDFGEHTKVIVLTNISKSEAPMEFKYLQVSQYIVKAHHTPTQVLEIIKEVLTD